MVDMEVAQEEATTAITMAMAMEDLGNMITMIQRKSLKTIVIAMEITILVLLEIMHTTNQHWTSIKNLSPKKLIQMITKSKIKNQKLLRNQKSHLKELQGNCQNQDKGSNKR